MSDDVFIAVVSSPNSYEATWHGAFRFDELNGYVGKLISAKSNFKPGPLTFDAPADLDKEALFCVIDGATFATAIWPGLYGHKINLFGPGSRVIDARFPTLIKGVHVGANECHIKSVTLFSPLFASLFGLQGFTATVAPTSRAFKIETKPNEVIKFKTQLWSMTIGTAGKVERLPDKLSPNLDLTGCATIECGATVSPIQALKLASQIEYFLSLVCLSFVSCERLNCVIEMPTTGGELVEVPTKGDELVQTQAEVIRAKNVRGAKTEFDLIRLPIRLEQVDFGAALHKFVEIFDSIEQSLAWYRIVMAEERYVEDKYFYAVRMIKSLYKNLGLEGQPDKGLLDVVDRICAKLPDDNERYTLVNFINNRVRPIFSKTWSLSDVIKDLKTRYSELKMVEVLDEKVISKLRGKEVHGSAIRLSIREQKFMACSYNLIAMLYALVILEHCGIAQDFLLSELRRPLSHAAYFSSDYVNQIRDLAT